MSKIGSSQSLPRIAITVGDVAGVGPELALKCAAIEKIKSRCVPLVFGPKTVLQAIGAKLNLNVPPSIAPTDIAGADSAAIVDAGDITSDQFEIGSVNEHTGRASFQAVDLAITQALLQDVDAIATGPIHKEAWHAAGIQFPGHTELLASRTGTSDFCMMLTSETISCVLATIHIPLADVATLLTTEKVLRAIRQSHIALSRRLGRSPKVTVCGLNPHAGENGLFSHGEETDIIQPAIAQSISDGIEVIGPLPPDTAFTPAMRATTDVYVCMYHDQGLIPLKALAFDDAVNVTLGLPIVRTSVDHGTALDLAGQGKANHQSMIAAIEMAIDLA
ncbi:4-hydroxythreonine-4-phosphate dehydrogenase PdxA [Planctomycetes bacterium K23_9]|uniref:4-hydroxythreonine-4-phosphate dehydrogenase n=1 Tax=Stieleria marina TaxID=1930275 RepID=A0A517P193_9BACT|nr:4-hydroxythreonine-4-phosphate dehydrogenase [Planctomycetes bacterium K23_9]